MTMTEQGSKTMKQSKRKAEPPRKKAPPLVPDKPPRIALQTFSAAAEQLQCSRGTIYNLVADGTLEEVRFRDSVRITERSINKLIESQIKQRA